MDWFKQGTDFPELDQATFAPGPIKAVEPVQPSSRWGLVQVIRYSCYLGYRAARRRT